MDARKRWVAAVLPFLFDIIDSQEADVEAEKLSVDIGRLEVTTLKPGTMASRTGTWNLARAPFSVEMVVVS